MVYVELNKMCKDLKALGIQNVTVLPNFRKIKKNSNYVLKNENDKIKMVFLSRVSREKGVFNLLDAIEKVTSPRKFSLHIYGPIDEIEDEFHYRISKVDNVKYLGVVDPNNVQDLLSNYTLLIFPTYYDGEGFPGIIIESFAAGLPVIASDWKYNSEIINHGLNGLLFKQKDVDDLKIKIEYCLNNYMKIVEMGICANKHAIRFSFDAANSILFPKTNKI